MPPEIEATFIDINKNKLREKLRQAGARLVQPEILMRRVVFDVDERTFVRVRDEGNKVTMSYKHLDDLSLSGMKEICLEVDDYEKTIAFVKACGLRMKADQETYREEWELDDVEITIDTWPWIPSYAEIEGMNEDAVKVVAEKLGFDMNDAMYGSVDQVYKVYYDVDVGEINYCPEIKFTDVPEWLEQKRKK